MGSESNMEKCKFNCTPKELRKCPKCGSSDVEFIESFYDDISDTIGGTGTKIKNDPDLSDKIPEDAAEADSGNISLDVQ